MKPENYVRMAAARDLLMRVKFYDLDQPRDNGGRWTSGGSAGDGTYPKIQRVGDLAGKPLPDHLRAAWGPDGYDRASLKEAMDKVPDAKAELKEFTDNILEQFGDRVLGKSAEVTKSWDSAVGKALTDPPDGITKNIKDLVRNTIITDDWADADAVVRSITEDITKAGGTVKLQSPEKYGGYRGYLINIKAGNGLMMEMQVNTPEMMYAKDGSDWARKIVGEDRWNTIREKSGKEPGQGHKYYEKVRSLSRDSVERQDAEREMREYYSVFLKEMKPD